MSNCFVLFGPPGAGKGTQASLLESRKNCFHLSSGSVLRSQIAAGTEIGVEVKSVMEQGSLVSDALLMQALESELLTRQREIAGRTVALDGVVRTLEQVSLVSSLLSRLNWRLLGVISLEATLDGLVERLSSRLTCKSCGYVVSSLGGQATPGGDCPKCSSAGSLERRKDDAPEAIERRFSVYEKETRPVLEALKPLAPLVSLNALRPPETVFEEVSKALDSFHGLLAK